MLNINKIVIAGNIGNDLQLRQTSSETSDQANFLRFNVSTRDENDETNAVNWHRCIAVGELAVRMEAACQQGTNVYLTGKIKTRYYDNGTATKKEVTELEVDHFQVVADGRVPAIDIEDYMSEKNSAGTAGKKDDVPF